MKARLLYRMRRHPNRGGGWLDVGSEIEHKDAGLLVLMGCAEPADEECEKATSYDPATQSGWRLAFERLQRGIHPDDFKAYDDGLMIGYLPETGQWKPGPTWYDGCEEEYAAAMKKSKRKATDDDE